MKRNAELTRMIPDGEDVYPESCVEYVRLRSYPLRHLFAYFREREFFLQKDVARFRGTTAETLAQARLEECQSHLIYMATNLEAKGEVETKQLELIPT